MHEVSWAVGPHHSTGFGWRTVKRAMRAGLIETRTGPKANRHYLYVTEA